MLSNVVDNLSALFKYELVVQVFSIFIPGFSKDEVDLIPTLSVEPMLTQESKPELSIYDLNS